LVLHVSGADDAALEAAVAQYRDRPGLEWRRISPGLEDAFIRLMQQARDNTR
jgi:ABC-2 type transport system ATP-binding protein